MHDDGRPPTGRKGLLHSERRDGVQEGSGVPHEKKALVAIAARRIHGRTAGPGSALHSLSSHECVEALRLPHLRPVGRREILPALHVRDSGIDHHREIPLLVVHGDRPSPPVRKALYQRMRWVWDVPSRGTPPEAHESDRVASFFPAAVFASRYHARAPGAIQDPPSP